jgi:hypothetical protein
MPESFVSESDVAKTTVRRRPIVFVLMISNASLSD